MVLGIALVWVGCATLQEEGAVSSPLAPTLQVRIERDSVVLDLHVTNVSEEPVRLEFPTSQRFDFVVERESGAELWRWSEGRMFAQVLGTETVAPGSTLHYRAAWAPPSGLRGTFEATGVLPAMERGIELSRAFELR